jgi:hypothetical protein
MSLPPITIIGQVGEYMEISNVSFICHSDSYEISNVAVGDQFDTQIELNYEIGPSIFEDKRTVVEPDR